MSGFTCVLSAERGARLPEGLVAGGNRRYRRGCFEAVESLLDKFPDDKAFQESEGLFICLDGVTLNARMLRDATAAPDLASAVARRCRARGTRFPDELRGGFGGLVYDPEEGLLRVFTNHFGTRYIFYSREPGPDGSLFFSSSLLDIATCLRASGREPRLDEVAAYWLLSFGYMLDDRTLIEGVGKIEAGCALEARLGNAPLPVRYYAYSNEEGPDPGLGAAADALYEGLSAAVKAGFEKDLEYGYRHASLLSGGLDSRMVAFFAHELGYKDVLTLTFGQSGCADERIASAIARDLGYEHLFRPLDGGLFLARGFRDSVAANDGLIIYAGSAHALTSYQMIDWSRYGLLHNGNLADASQGDYVDRNRHEPPEASVWAYSKRFLPRVQAEIDAVLARYPNQESFAIATRGVNAILNGSVSAQGLTETDEPFLHPDLVDRVSRMPARYKAGERAFIAMIERRFPAATRYPWQKWGTRPSLATLERRGMLPFKLARRARRLFEKGFAGMRGKPDPADMNPFGHWLMNSPELVSFFSESRGLVEEFADGRGRLGADCLALFDTGSSLERCQAMTLAAAAARLGLR